METYFHDLSDALVVNPTDNMSNENKTLNPKIFQMILQFVATQDTFAH